MLCHTYGRVVRLLESVPDVADGAQALLLTRRPRRPALVAAICAAGEHGCKGCGLRVDRRGRIRCPLGVCRPWCGRAAVGRSMRR